MTDGPNQQEQLELAQAAARGDRVARAQVNRLIHPVIDYHSDKFCKRFCYENCFLYRCSLPRPIGSGVLDAQSCEWGNASYGWMLDDLTRSQRLQRYEARNGATLFDYLYRIANSLAFYERWKDWRFDRRVYVPVYIQQIAPQAARIFHALRSVQELPLIAQQVALPLNEVEAICRSIVTTLTKRKRLYLLDPPTTQSLTGSDEEQGSAANQKDIADWDESLQVQQQKSTLNQAWKRLEPVERFVLESLVIDEQSAQSVLQSLAALNISIKQGVSADQTNAQQLYYFKRKALAKLSQVLSDE